VAFARNITEVKESESGSSVVVVIHRETGELVLVKEITKPTPHYRKFPGGRINKKDLTTSGSQNLEVASQAAAVREVLEETGLNVAVLPVNKVRKGNHFLFIFLGLTEDGPDKIKTEEIGLEVKFFTREEVEELIRNGELLPSHIPIFHRAIRELEGG
jgi:8-oxo-dGTP pyrophosphatase MutT (NUDIX family)